MAGMINELLVILNEQADRCEELLGLSKEKKGVIVANEVESLQKITHLENLIVSQHQKLERKRIALIKDMAIVLNKKEKDLTIAALADLMEGQEEQASLREVNGRLKKTLTELAEVNALNSQLIQNALDYIEYSMNVIRSSAAAGPSLYSNRGEQIEETRAMFDAKH